MYLYHFFERRIDLFQESPIQFAFVISRLYLEIATFFVLDGSSYIQSHQIALKHRNSLGTLSHKRDPLPFVIAFVAASSRLRGGDCHVLLWSSGKRRSCHWRFCLGQYSH